jgi:peptidoglycan hydrolase-like protein with peptidoglycan-binding domain
MLIEPGPDGATSSPTETKRHRLPRAPLHFRRDAGARTGTRRNTALGIALAAVVAASAVGWVAGRRIQSPAEIASRTAPPAPSLITVPVELRTLTSDVVGRGTVRYGSPQTVTLPASTLKPGTSIVSIAPVKGAALNEGSVALSVSGRPVLVLQGAQPAHRDLGPGAVGEDVRQLQASLARLGFDPGARNSVYGSSTASAVAAWYRAAGWTPLGPTDEQLLALRTAESEVFGARSERANADEALTTARNSRTTANASVRTTTSALNAANEAKRAAQHQLNAALASQPPLTPTELAALEAGVIQATAAVDVARADVAAAKDEVSNAEAAIQTAERRVSLNAGRVTETGSAASQINAKLGIQLPANEVLFFPSLPLRVDDVTVKVGDELTGPVMTVSNSQLAVDGALSLNDAKLVRTGAAVTIEASDSDIHATGTVSELADTPGTRGVEPQRYYFGVTFTENAPAALVGASVVLKITVSSTKGDVLALPIAALSVAADGTSRVQVRERGASTRNVTVTPGLAAKGMVEVTPTEGSLAAGDLVVVGRSTRAAVPRGSGG